MDHLAINNLEIKTRFMLLLGLFVSGFCVFGIWTFTTISEIKVNGLLYERIVQSKVWVLVFVLLGSIGVSVALALIIARSILGPLQDQPLQRPTKARSGAWKSGPSPQTRQRSNPRL